MAAQGACECCAQAQGARMTAVRKGWSPVAQQDSV
jgi:hypothetical protein